MAIIKPDALDFSAKSFCMVLSGQPGLGKTTLALSAPDPLLFDLDNGIARVRAEHRGLTTINETYDDLLNDMQTSEYKECKSVIIDTGGSLVQLMQPWAKTQDAKAARDGRAMYGVIKREFDRLTAQIRQDKKNCIIVFHTTETQKGDLTVTRLSCEGSSKDIVWTPADLGAHMFMMGQKRVIGFSPTEEYFAKSCFGINGIREVPTLKSGDKNDFLTRLFDEARANIAKDMEAFGPKRAVYDKAMKFGRAFIDGADGVDKLNLALDQIGGIEHALTSKKELGALLNAKAKELGCKFSKEEGAYVPNNA